MHCPAAASLSRIQPLRRSALVQRIVDQREHPSDAGDQFRAHARSARLRRFVPQRPRESGVVTGERPCDLVDDLALVLGHRSGVMLHDDLHGGVADLVHGLAHGAAGHEHERRVRDAQRSARSRRPASSG